MTVENIDIAILTTVFALLEGAIIYAGMKLILAGFKTGIGTATPVKLEENKAAADRYYEYLIKTGVSSKAADFWRKWILNEPKDKMYGARIMVLIGVSILLFALSLAWDFLMFILQVM